MTPEPRLSLLSFLLSSLLTSVSLFSCGRVARGKCEGAGERETEYGRLAFAPKERGWLIDWSVLILPERRGEEEKKTKARETWWHNKMLLRILFMSLRQAHRTRQGFRASANLLT